MLKNLFTILTIIFVNSLMFANDYFVASNGNDSNNGTISNPVESIKRAQELASSGDTVYIRGGNYTMREDQIARYFDIWAYVTELNKNGINYYAYQDEKPVFDYSNIKPANKRIFAFYLTGSNIHIRGIEIIGVQVTITTHTQSECFEIKGSNNILENISMHNNMAIGVYILRGSNNLILNCDAYENWDSVSEGGRGGNVDGFGCHVRNGDTGNIFRGCRAWLNSDDGFDLINSAEPVLIENCWAFYNGYSSVTGTGSDLVSRGDGTGFKAGGYGKAAQSFTQVRDRYSPIPMNTVQFCIAAKNRLRGFYANHHLNGNYWYNNSAFQNPENYNMLNCKALNATDYGTDVDGWGHVMANNLGAGASSPSNEVTKIDKPRCILNNNYFDLSVSITPEDFIAYDIELLKAPRKLDGNLPDTDFLKLAPNSDLIDAGYDVGFSFNGVAPDLGYSESGTLSLKKNEFLNNFSNFPNPFLNETRVVFNLKQASKIKTYIYNLMGLKVFELPERTFSTGKNSFNLNRNELASGNYLLVLKSSDGQKNTKLISVN
ncbi:right-handed parallel beta-helix repeat-containing protein [Thalassobellus sediminis]|uniref:right-handed parallel beta-helix repeat-containing protein n=1 Tax=Thalassobellus sediminis TaxID=3367753 RepID=UPI00378B9E9F